MRCFLLASLFSLAALPALAAPWVIDPSSTLTFSGSQAGDAFTGSFTKFTPVVEFDPAKPEAATMVVTVDMGSATIADRDKQESLPTSDWFHVEQFPTATFTSTRVRAAASAKDFVAEGDLTVRGIRKPVQLAFSFVEHNGTATVDGAVQLKRNDFGVGQGQWTTDEWIAYPVDVKFHLVARKP